MELGHIVLVRKGKSSSPYELDHGEHTIGSAEGCNIRLKLTHPLLLKTHAIIRVSRNGVATIINKSTAAPVKVNGKVTFKPTILRHEDTFLVLDKEFRYFNEKLKDVPETSDIFVEEKKRVLASSRKSVMPLTPSYKTKGKAAKTPSQRLLNTSVATSLKKSMNTSVINKSLNKASSRRSMMARIQSNLTPSVRMSRNSNSRHMPKKSLGSIQTPAKEVQQNLPKDPQTRQSSEEQTSSTDLIIFDSLILGENVSTITGSESILEVLSDQEETSFSETITGSNKKPSASNNVTIRSSRRFSKGPNLEAPKPENEHITQSEHYLNLPNELVGLELPEKSLSNSNPPDTLSRKSENLSANDMNNSLHQVNDLSKNACLSRSGSSMDSEHSLRDDEPGFTAHASNTTPLQIVHADNIIISNISQASRISRSDVRENTLNLTDPDEISLRLSTNSLRADISGHFKNTPIVTRRVSRRSSGVNQASTSLYHIENIENQSLKNASNRKSNNMGGDNTVSLSTSRKSLQESQSVSDKIDLTKENASNRSIRGTRTSLGTSLLENKDSSKKVSLLAQIGPRTNRDSQNYVAEVIDIEQLNTTKESLRLTRNISRLDATDNELTSNISKHFDKTTSGLDVSNRSSRSSSESDSVDYETDTDTSEKAVKVGSKSSSLTTEVQVPETRGIEDSDDVFVTEEDASTDEESKPVQKNSFRKNTIADDSLNSVFYSSPVDLPKSSKNRESAESLLFSNKMQSSDKLPLRTSARLSINTSSIASNEMSKSAPTVSHDGHVYPEREGAPNKPNLSRKSVEDGQFSGLDEPMQGAAVAPRMFSQDEGHMASINYSVTKAFTEDNHMEKSLPRRSTRRSQSNAKELAVSLKDIRADQSSEDSENSLSQASTVQNSRDTTVDARPNCSNSSVSASSRLRTSKQIINTFDESTQDNNLNDLKNKSQQREGNSEESAKRASANTSSDRSMTPLIILDSPEQVLSPVKPLPSRISVRNSQDATSASVASRRSSTRRSAKDEISANSSLTMTSLEQSTGSVVTISSQSFSSFKQAGSNVDDTEIDVVNITASSGTPEIRKSARISANMVKTPDMEGGPSKRPSMTAQMFETVSFTSTPFPKSYARKETEQWHDTDHIRNVELTRTSRSKSLRKTNRTQSVVLICSTDETVTSPKLEKSRSTSSTRLEVTEGPTRRSNRSSTSRNDEYDCVSCKYSSVRRSRSLSTPHDKIRDSSTETKNGPQDASLVKRPSAAAACKTESPLLHRKSHILSTSEDTLETLTTEKDETPKSHVKSITRRSSSVNQSTYNPVLEDITPVTPENLRASVHAQETFKTPINTPGLFESIRKSATRAKKRHRETNGSAMKVTKRARMEEYSTWTPELESVIISEKRPQKSPVNRLSNFEGVKELMRSPPKSAKNDSRNVSNSSRLVSPKQQDLTAPITSAKKEASPANDLTNVSGVAHLFNESEVEVLHNGSDIENSEDLFTKLSGKRAVKAYPRSKTLSPVKPNAYGLRKSRKSMDDLPVCSPRVQQWVVDHASYNAENESNKDMAANEERKSRVSQKKATAQKKNTPQSVEGVFDKQQQLDVCENDLANITDQPRKISRSGRSSVTPKQPIRPEVNRRKTHGDNLNRIPDVNKWKSPRELQKTSEFAGAKENEPSHQLRRGRSVSSFEVGQNEVNPKNDQGDDDILNDVVPNEATRAMDVYKGNLANVADGPKKISRTGRSMTPKQPIRPEVYRRKTHGDNLNMIPDVNKWKTPGELQNTPEMTDAKKTRRGRSVSSFEVGQNEVNPKNDQGDDDILNDDVTNEATRAMAVYECDLANVAYGPKKISRTDRSMTPKQPIRREVNRRKTHGDNLSRIPDVSKWKTTGEVQNTPEMTDAKKNRRGRSVSSFEVGQNEVNPKNDQGDDNILNDDVPNENASTIDVYEGDLANVADGPRKILRTGRSVSPRKPIHSKISRRRKTQGDILHTPNLDQWKSQKNFKTTPGVTDDNESVFGNVSNQPERMLRRGRSASLFKINLNEVNRRKSQGDILSEAADVSKWRISKEKATTPTTKVACKDEDLNIVEKSNKHTPGTLTPERKRKRTMLVEDLDLVAGPATTNRSSKRTVVEKSNKETPETSKPEIKRKRTVSVEDLDLVSKNAATRNRSSKRTRTDHEGITVDEIPPPGKSEEISSDIAQKETMPKKGKTQINNTPVATEMEIEEIREIAPTKVRARRGQKGYENDNTEVKKPARKVAKGKRNISADKMASREQTESKFEPPEIPDIIEGEKVVPRSRRNKNVREVLETPEASEVIELKETTRSRRNDDPKEVFETPQMIELKKAIRNRRNKDVMEVLDSPDIIEVKMSTRSRRNKNVGKALETPEAPEIIEVKKTTRSRRNDDLKEALETPEVPDIIEGNKTTRGRRNRNVREMLETPESTEIIEVKKTTRNRRNKDVNVVLDTPKSPEIIEVKKTTRNRRNKDVNVVLDTPKSPEIIEVKKTTRNRRNNDVKKEIPEIIVEEVEAKTTRTRSGRNNNKVQLATTPEISNINSLGQDVSPHNLKVELGLRSSERRGQKATYTSSPAKRVGHKVTVEITEETEEAEAVSKLRHAEEQALPASDIGQESKMVTRRKRKHDAGVPISAKQGRRTRKEQEEKATSAGDEQANEENSTAESSRQNIRAENTIENQSIQKTATKKSSKVRKGKKAQSVEPRGEQSPDNDVEVPTLSRVTSRKDIEEIEITSDFTDEEVEFNRPTRLRAKKATIAPVLRRPRRKVVAVDRYGQDFHAPTTVATRAANAKSRSKQGKVEVDGRPINKLIDDVIEIDVDSPRTARAKRGINKKYSSDQYEVTPPVKKVRFAKSPAITPKRTRRAKN